MWQPVQRHRIAIGGVALALALVVSAFLVITSSRDAAQATLGDLTCVGGSGTIAISPGVTFATQTGEVGVTGNLGNCLSLSLPAITGGTFALDGTGTGNCVTGGSASAAGTVSWSNGTQSTVTASLSLGLIAGIPTMRGESSVTGGPFTGDLGFTLPLVAGFDPAQCGSPNGVTSATFAGAETAGL
jgi:hypothetical protein